MTYVISKEKENFDNLLKKFKKRIEKDEVLLEYKKRKFYEKPSAKKKREKKQARLRWLRKLKKEEG